MNQGSRVLLDHENPVGTSALIAWDPVGQREVWRARQPEMINGGTIATAGGLVFAGNAHGEFNAFDAAKGYKLWAFNQPIGILAAPTSYSVGGVQYVAVLAGKGGAAMGVPDMKRPRIPRLNGRILVFKLGGKARLPHFDLALPPVTLPTEQFSPVVVKAGELLYGNRCARCHEGVAAPDLRRSPVLADRATWKSVVIDGVLTEGGMIGFSKMMTAEQAESIRAFVGTLAGRLQKQDKAAPLTGVTSHDLARAKLQ